MATTKIGICNLALRKLKLKSLIDFDTDDNEIARTMRDIYEFILKEVMGEHSWNFAIKRILLDTPTDTPVYEFAYAFVLPADCLRVIDTEDKIKYQVENGLLLCNSATVKIKYIYYNETVALYSQNFIGVFALRLAYELAYSEAGSTEMRQILADDDVRKLSKSKSVDGQESPPEKEDNSSWLDSRK